MGDTSHLLTLYDNKLLYHKLRQIHIFIINIYQKEDHSDPGNDVNPPELPTHPASMAF